jgi:hypothetical protein
VTLLQLTNRIVFFTDQNLSGDTVPQAIIKASGYPCQRHKDNFSINAEDVDWLGPLGDRGWILVTKDWGILKRPVERDALLAAKVRAFVFRERRLKGEVMAEILTLAMPKMLRAIDTYKAPFVYSLEVDGSIIALSALEKIKEAT